LKKKQKFGVLSVGKIIMQINVHIPSKRLRIIKKNNGLIINALYADRTFGVSIGDMIRRFMITIKTYSWSDILV